ncbi:hypothetical protein ACFWZT_08640 [Streptomyces alboflavus]|uniref:hypothetical protein n=1 Tax=Streptomyces alboflavus TaxID=67267 RepID=UPI0036C17E03
MPKFESSWTRKTLYFSKSETADLADGATAASIAGAAFPDPVVSKIISMVGGTIALLAHRAVKQGKGLAFTVYGLPPFPQTPPIPSFHDRKW